ncbi:MAG: lipopolysaccharide biosynthesis protein [Azonexus sp.]
MSLAHSTLRGVLWNFSELLLRRGVTAFTTVLLAAFLAPSDFGLISMSALFVLFAVGVIDSGLREAMIRRKHLSARLLKSSMVATLVLSLIVYMVLFFSAPLLSEFYNEHRLTALIRVGGVQILISALQMPPVAKLQQQLDFKSLMKSSFPAALISSFVALTLAWIGCGVWALVAQSLISSTITTIGVWHFSRVRVACRTNLKLLVPLYRFGYQLFLSGLIALSVRNSVPALLGRFVGATTAGYYYFVDKILEVVMGQLVYSVQNVTYPAFSKIDQARGDLREGYRKVIQVTVFIVSPVLCISAGLSKELFQLFFSSEWWPAAECFQWLSLAYLMYPLHAINLNILKVKGRSDLFFRLEIIKAIIAVSVLFFTIRYGLIEVLIGQVVVSVFCYLPNVFFTEPLIKYSFRDQLIDVFPYFVFSMISGLVATFLASTMSSMHLVIEVFISIFGALFCYLGLAKIAKLKALYTLYDIFRILAKKRASL